MEPDSKALFSQSVQNQQDANALIEQLIAVAHPSSVYDEPQTLGDTTVITASEVSVGLGFGYGMGGGSGWAPPKEGEESPQEAENPSPAGGEGVGGGGGGGGAAMARPVAVITVGPAGVTVQPVVDVTKIGIAMFTAVGAMWVMLARMKRGG
jgi:uncharacterized spore protein YtfJ